MGRDATESSNLFARIIFALIIVILGSIFWRVGVSVVSEGALHPFEKGMMILGGLLTVIGLIYVSLQRIQMRRNEKFRREKW